MFEELKPILQNGERYVIVERGKPEYVVLRFHDYVRLTEGSPKSHWDRSVDAPRTNDWQIANHALADARPAPAADPGAIPGDPTTIRLEDLPL